MLIALRRTLLTGPIMGLVRGMLPAIGDTERIALEAGTTWFEGEIFRGQPNFAELLDFEIKPLTDEEEAFIAGPTETLCRMIDDWQIARDNDLPKPVWDFIKAEKFLGMIIPKSYGGLGFSAAAHAAVVTKIASRSVATAVTVMVPNSLGPGELLMRYGTEAQKNKYLAKLAVGEEIPCFGLTEPEAGSDAANGQSQGVVGYAEVNGEKVLGVYLTFNKRYITLAPIATVVGLAFKLKDPDNLLGKGTAPGITLALLPRSTKGLEIGRRHDPMGIGFMNGPLSGKDVFVPLDCLIGGAEYAGQGWRMLMEALAAGRGISLPSLSVGAAQLSLRAASGYALVRRQFGLPIGKFEGIRERLARLAANTYLMTATQRVTAGAIDAGEHPSVVSAIAKAYLTEIMRLALNDAMDIQAGAAIIQGPRNIFARPYASIPIGITVEGANILTRSLITFGQGATRCHPYLQAEVNALQNRDKASFDKAFVGHVKYLLKNIGRATAQAYSNGRLSKVPKGTPFTQEYRQLGRLSAAFSLVAETGLITMGGDLKRREYLSGRYADVLAHLFMASCALKHAHDVGYPNHHKAVVRLAVQNSLRTAEQALQGVIENLPNRPAAWALKLLALPLLRIKNPRDKATDAVVNDLLHTNGLLRTDLGNLIYIPEPDQPGMGALEAAYKAAMAAQPLLAKLPKGLSLAEAETQNLLTPEEAKVLAHAAALAADVVQVDAK